MPAFPAVVVSNASRTISLALEYDKGFWLFYKRADVTFYYNKSFYKYSPQRMEKFEVFLNNVSALTLDRLYCMS